MLKKWLTWNNSRKGISLLSSFLCSALFIWASLIKFTCQLDLSWGFGLSFEGLCRRIGWGLKGLWNQPLYLLWYPFMPFYPFHSYIWSHSVSTSCSSYYTLPVLHGEAALIWRWSIASHSRSLSHLISHVEISGIGYLWAASFNHAETVQLRAFKFQIDGDRRHLEWMRVMVGTAELSQVSVKLTESSGMLAGKKGKGFTGGVHSFVTLSIRFIPLTSLSLIGSISFIFVISPSTWQHIRGPFPSLSKEKKTGQGNGMCCRSDRPPVEDIRELKKEYITHLKLFLVWKSSTVCVLRL